MSRIGKTVQIIRQARGDSIKDLARKAKISTAYLSLIESGKRQPSLSVLQQIGKALCVPSELLILLAQPRDSNLKTSNKRIERMASALNRMRDAETRLRESLQQI